MDLSWLHFSARFPLRLPSAVKEPTEIRRDKSACDFGSTPSGLIADVGTDSVVSLPGLPILEHTGLALSLQISNSRSIDFNFSHWPLVFWYRGTNYDFDRRRKGKKKRKKQIAVLIAVLNFKFLISKTNKRKSCAILSTALNNSWSNVTNSNNQCQFYLKSCLVYR